jgi:hypothetical protein
MPHLQTVTHPNCGIHVGTVFFGYLAEQNYELKKTFCYEIDIISDCGNYGNRLAPWRIRMERRQHNTHLVGNSNYLFAAGLHQARYGRLISPYILCCFS